MTIASALMKRPARLSGPPGLYVEDIAPATPEAPVLMSGVPAFVGFALPRGKSVRGEFGGPRMRIVVIERWDVRGFDALVAPAPQSFLRMAVLGFFANGGKRCIVVMVPPPAEADEGGAALVRAFEPGGLLDDRNDIDLICIPDAMSSLVTQEDARREVYPAVLAHCESMGDRFAILDAPDVRLGDESGDEGGNEADPVGTMLRFASSLRSPYGALYGPWISIDPSQEGGASETPRAGAEEWRSLRQPPHEAESGATGFIPPCGQVAGLFARVDAAIGSQHAPANEILAGVVDTSVHLTAAQHGVLNGAGVNCLRSLRGRGIEVGGARTLSGHSLMPYVSTARVILGFRRWLAVGMRDLVFEPLTTELWDQVRVRLVSHCLELQQAGALAGADSDEAFFVKCDAEINTAAERDLGRVVAHVGLAPSVPAEFIVVRVVHDASGLTVSGLS